MTNIISNAGRFRRAPNFYDRIAAYTGGTVYNIDKNDIAAVLDQVIEVISNSTHSLLLLLLLLLRQYSQSRCLFSLLLLCLVIYFTRQRCRKTVPEREDKLR